MSLRSSAAFFAKLIPSILADLRRIASRSRGETTVEDLQTEAWLVAEELSRDREPQPDAEDKGFHQLILGRLYNRFVKFADKRFRFAVRLDETQEDENGGPRTNAVMATLAASDISQPLQVLEAREEESSRERRLLARFAEAVAYLHLFDALKLDRFSVANHLAISVSTLRRRVNRAERHVIHQPSLFDGVAIVPAGFMPPRAVSYRRKRRARIRLFADRNQAKLFPRAYVPLRRL